MDENPYKAPQAAPAKNMSRRLGVWDWVAVIGAIVYIGSMVVREVTEAGTTANDYARIAHDIGGVTMVVWSIVYFARRALAGQK